MHESIEDKKQQIVAACERFGVVRLEIFGSGARGIDFDPNRSDADFLVEFKPDAEEDLYFELKETFERILGRHVDLIDRRAIEQSRNYIRRRHILSRTEAVYVAQ